MTAWTPEPWRHIWLEHNKRTKMGDYVFFGTELPIRLSGVNRPKIAQANADRVVACVNACEGLAEPGHDIKVMALALRDIQRHVQYALDHPNDPLNPTTLRRMSDITWVGLGVLKVQIPALLEILPELPDEP